MKITQISSFLENKPGHLSSICRTLAQADINILTLSLADTQQFGILRLIVKDVEKAKKILTDTGFLINTTEVVAIEVEDQPGRLADILKVIEDAKLNVEYMYAFSFHSFNKAVLIFRFDEPDVAIQELSKNNVNILNSITLFGE